MIDSLILGRATTLYEKQNIISITTYDTKS